MRSVGSFQPKKFVTLLAIFGVNLRLWAGAHGSTIQQLNNEIVFAQRIRNQIVICYILRVAISRIGAASINFDNFRLRFSLCVDIVRLINSHIIIIIIIIMAMLHASAMIGVFGSTFDAGSRQ